MAITDKIATEEDDLFVCKIKIIPDCDWPVFINFNGISFLFDVWLALLTSSWRYFIWALSRYFEPFIAQE